MNGKPNKLHLTQCAGIGAMLAMSIAVVFGIALGHNERFANIFLRYTLPSLAFVGAGAGAAAGYVGHKQGYDQALSDLNLKLVNLPEEFHATESPAENSNAAIAPSQSGKMA